MSDLPDTNAAEGRRWLDQATEELLAARRLTSDPELSARIACFLAHLAAEKALKAWLIASGTPFARVHDLADLQALLPPEVGTTVRDDDLALLNPWAIEGRYPSDIVEATRTQAHDCIAAAERVLDAAKRAVGA